MSKEELIKANEELWKIVGSIAEFTNTHSGLPTGAYYHLHRAQGKLVSASGFITTELRKQPVEENASE